MPKHKSRVLVVDDKLEMAEMVAEALADKGYEPVALTSSAEALQRLKTETFHAVVTDLRMPKVDGLELLGASRKLVPERPVLVMTAYGAIDSAIEAIRQGAYHYFTKPFKMEELAVYLERALDEAQVRGEARTLRETLRAQHGLEAIVGQSPPMRRVLDVIERIAPTDAPVLLLGETGTGKGRLAHALHALSPRSTKPFVTVNCAALPEALLESELFGHRRGAFTGATADRLGLFVEADGGTLFLDEIGEMSPALQAKLLHVLEDGRVRPVGASAEQSIDVRVLSATHRNLREQITKGAFREDLFYRLEVISVEIPPLRQRREDLRPLLEHFLGTAQARHPSSPVRRLSRATVDALMQHTWPGNVRELSHLMERLVLLGTGEEIQPDELPSTVSATPSESLLSFVGNILSARELQHRYALWALDQLGGNKARTADKLHIDVRTLGKWLSDGGDVEEP